MKWLATLEAFLKESDVGLDHAKVREGIADYFMDKKDFARAKPYAEAAATSGAAWAMRCAGKCAEGLGDWTAAESYAKSEAGRYDNSYYAWFFWCLRTGLGDLAAARKSVEDVLENVVGRQAADDRVVTGLLHASGGAPGKSPPLYKSLHDEKRDDNALLVAAMEYDALGDPISRDQTFADWPEKNPFEPLLALFQRKLREGEKMAPSRAEIEEALKLIPAEREGYACYAIGRFVQRREQGSLAVEYLNRCGEKSYNRNTLGPVLAGMALREIERAK